jgi:hypothetical protein
MRTFAVWYRYGGEEDYVIVSAWDFGDAAAEFRANYDGGIVDIREVSGSERSLAWC